MIHTQLRFQVSSRQKIKHSPERGQRNWKPTLYIRIMSDPSGASLNLNLNLNPEVEAEAAAEHEQRAVGSGQRVSNAKINATQRCQLPVSQVALSSDYYPIYMQCILFSSFFLFF